MVDRALKLDDLTIRRIFGSEDAESEEPDRVKEYFLVNGAYQDLITDLPLRIVTGHKGVGKSALLKRAYLEDVEKGILAVQIQPNDIAELMISNSSEAFIQKIERWKSGIKRIVAAKTVEKLIERGFDSVDSTRFKSIGLNATKFGVYPLRTGN